MKKIMFVGSVGVGKTTLTQRLKGLDIEYRLAGGGEAAPLLKEGDPQKGHEQDDQCVHPLH